MTRPAAFSVAALAAVLVLVAGCERPPVGPRPETNTASTFDNTAAEQSIMQAEVVAANPPAPTPTPTTEPAEPRSATVLFVRGAALDDAARRDLDAFVAAVPPEARLVLRGHSDSSGGDRANLALSRRRAVAVRDYLADQGIPAARMEVIALGERRPVAPNAALDGSDDPAGRAKNRRVDVELLSPPAPEPTPTATPTPAMPSPAAG